MKKKLSLITALALSALSLAPMSASAIAYRTNSYDVIKGWIKDRTEIDPKYNCLYNNINSTGKTDDEVSIYVNESRTCATIVYELDVTKSLMIPAEGVTLEQINEVLSQNFEAVAVGTPADTWYEYPRLLGGTEEINGETYYLLSYVRHRDREISDLLKEEGLITGYMTQTGFYSKQDYSFDQILDYKYYSDIAKANAISDYVIEKGLAVPKFYDYQYDDEGTHSVAVESAEEGDYMLLETPDGETLEQQLDIALEIYEELGVVPYGISPEIAYFAGGEVIDLYNAVEGDANNDGEIDIADATLILQYIGNSDKYSLSAQGAYNADADGSGDVTALDALEIQRIDAKMT